MQTTPSRAKIIKTKKKGAKKSNLLIKMRHSFLENNIKGKFRVIIIEWRLRGRRPRGAISELMLHFTVNDVKEETHPSNNLPFSLQRGCFQRALITPNSNLSRIHISRVLESYLFYMIQSKGTFFKLLLKLIMKIN